MIRLLLDQPVPSTWGEFEVRKTYQVANPDGSPANGYIIQQVVKRTSVTMNGTTYTTSTDISTLTSGNVLNASDTYYELFPILNGTTCRGPGRKDRANCIDDQFQNGGIGRYTFESDTPGGEKTWALDDDPPTSGTIQMVGRNVFVPTTPADADALYATIQANRGGTLTLNGVVWNLSPRTPANGLPFTASFPLFSSLIRGKPIAVHTVTVTWTPDGRTNVTSVQSMSVGGKRRRTIRGRVASRSYRKRRTGTSRRRSRGQA